MKKIYSFIIILLTFYGKALASAGSAQITGIIAGSQNGDSVIVYVNKYGFSYADALLGVKTYRAKISNRKFSIKIDMADRLLFANIFIKTRSLSKILNNYLIRKGDRITMRADSNGLSYTGGGASRFQALNRLDKVLDEDFNSRIGEDLLRPEGLINVYRKLDLACTRQLSLLNTQKRSLPAADFILMKARILSVAYGEIGVLYTMNYAGLKDSAGAAALASIRNYKRMIPRYLLDNDDFRSNAVLLYAGSYASGLIAQYRLDSCYLMNRPFRLSQCYKFISGQFTGALRERMITGMFYQYRGSGEDIAEPLQDALQYVRNQDFLKVLKTLGFTRVKGAAAYDFSLRDTADRVRRLQDYTGKVIVIDFWYTGCGNCIKIAPYMRELEQYFSGKPVVFLSINVDKTRKQWIQGIKSGKYNAPDAVNLFTEGRELRHPMCTYYGVDACPTLLLIDRQGRLMQNPLDPRIDGGDSLKTLISASLQGIHS